MKIAIFGGNGFLGQYLCNYLLQDSNFFLRVVGKSKAKISTFLKHDRCEQILGNFSDETLVRSTLDGVDIAYHLISSTLPASSNLNPVLDLEQNLLPTIKFLEAARDSGVKKIIFFSSGGTIYGDTGVCKISENDRTNPICSYGIQKLAIEKYLYLFKKLYGLNYGILRISNPYGKNQNILKKQGFIQTAISNAMREQPIEIWGDGSVVRDYLHAQDVARAASDLIYYDGPQNIFNIGSGVGYSINQIISMIEDCLVKKLQVSYSSPRAFDLQSNILDISLAAKELSWAPSITLEKYINGQFSELKCKN